MVATMMFDLVAVMLSFQLMMMGSSLVNGLTTSSSVKPLGRFLNLNLFSSSSSDVNDSANDNHDGNDEDEKENLKKHTSTLSLSSTRRQAMIQSVSAAFATATAATTAPSASHAIGYNPFSPLDQKSNGGIYEPAKRATAYLVDSTIPPTLVPFRASREAAILKQIGSGLGTQKSPFIEEKLNLNNMMNKGVFGTIDLVKELTKSATGNAGNDDDGQEMEIDPKKKKGQYDASFVFMGVDYNDSNDAELAIGLMTDILKPRRGLGTAVALEYVPLSLQPVLDAYIASSSSSTNEADAEKVLMEALSGQGGVSQTIIDNQMPVLKFAKSKQLVLIASAPERTDMETVRKEGLQNVNQDRRAAYVVDPDGFIGWTQDAKNRMYTDKSLLKDFRPIGEDDKPGNYFAERILVHETMASSIAKYAVRHPQTLVVGIAPIRDLRYLGGPNGRVSRICKVIKGDMKVDEEAVTTILLNPSAEETLSKSKFLRLEIGTAPALLQYQTKVSDYLWFSSMPKVNLIPRMMNGP